METRKLARPINDNVDRTRAAAPIPDDMDRKREIARKQAQDKVKARTLAKQQQLAERIAVATGQMASGIEEASSAAEQLGATIQQIAKGAGEASSAAEQSRAAINQVDKASVIADKNAKDALDRAEVSSELIIPKFHVHFLLASKDTISRRISLFIKYFTMFVTTFQVSSINYYFQLFYENTY